MDLPATTVGDWPLRAVPPVADLVLRQLMIARGRSEQYTRQRMEAQTPGLVAYHEEIAQHYRREAALWEELLDYIIERYPTK